MVLVMFIINRRARLGHSERTVPLHLAFAMFMINRVTWLEAQ
jgi:hypothetical protein